MGLMASRMPVRQYRVNGRVPDPFYETVLAGLEKHAARGLSEGEAMAAGWASMENPYGPFWPAGAWTGRYIMFALRIDSKKVPAGALKAHVEQAQAKRVAETGRGFLARGEKKRIREEAERRLLEQVPAQADVFDVVWDVESESGAEDGTVWFFGTRKKASEELEALFLRSFGVPLLPMFPFTFAETRAGLAPSALDALSAATPTWFGR